MPGLQTVDSPFKQTTAASIRLSPWFKVILYGCVAGAAVGIVTEIFRVLVGRNFNVVIPGRVFRCAQLEPEDLQRTVAANGIRTVVNLRGFGPASDWYADECRVTHHLDINQEDVSFSASRMPSVSEVRRLIEVLDRTEYPILFHCRQGADRTGLASAISLLLHTDADVATAKRQLSLRYGHFRVGRAGHLDRFVETYEGWLSEHGKSHTREAFREWALSAYVPGECRCEYEPLEMPSVVRANEPTPMRIRVHNRGLGSWQFRAENHVGFHLCFVLRDESERGVHVGRTGLYDTVVEPGQSIDLTMVLPSVKKPGRYRLVVDMVDELHCWFSQTGTEFLEHELIVE